MGAPCPHQYIIDKNFSAKLLAEKKEKCCEWCGAGGCSLRLCLYSGCLRVGCGEGHADHSTQHNNQFPSHCITLNLTSLRSWCYMCEMEVTSSVLASMTIPLGQQHHLGGPISAPGVAVAQPITPSQSSAEEEEEEEEGEEVKAKGLVGLCNLGLTCYMNSALQAMSNSVPLAQFMIECPAFLCNDRKTPCLARPFQRLMVEMWHKKRPSFITPSLLYHGFKQLYPMFRGYTQQDSQEFLRYFMDQLHEELKEPLVISHEDDNIGDLEEEDLSAESLSEREDSQSEAEYETCDSGVSEQSSGSSDQYPSKRKKRHHATIDVETGIATHRATTRSLFFPDHESPEFSDAVSDTTLLDSDSAGVSSSASPQVHSSSTSGLGSSKPSISSLSSSFKGKACGTPGRRRKPPTYRSVISDIFDGTIVSSVQCLTCNTISSRKETFQDLSLPIPSSDQLSILQHSSASQLQQVAGSSLSSSSLHLAKTSCDTATDGWMWWLWVWVRSWLWGPAVSLHHCLAAFFSADELKGDNMYSCEKCGKLRNGVKYSKVLQLPEVLIVHLKRFRHETMFSSKISQYVSFPLHGLDLTQFLHKDCTSEVVTYDLYAIICHHGTAGGGHYTAYCQNWSNHRWYEFDDQYVTEVSSETVAKCEAYVLFYKKTSPEMTSRRQRTVELMQVSSREPSLMQFYISKQWVNKFNTFSEPGPINNYDFLCPHGGVQPQKANYVGELVMLLNQGVWEYLHQVFGGGPACTRLYECVTCRAELDALSRRQTSELEMFLMLKKLFQEEEHPNIVAISMRWFRTWESFVRGREQEPPGPIDNSSICTSKTGQPVLKPGSDYAQISEEMWHFFYKTYGGGPELSVMYGNPHGSARRSEKVEGMRPEAQKQEQLQSESRSLSTEHLPHSGACTSRQRTVSAGEQVMRVSPPTHTKQEQSDAEPPASPKPSTISTTTSTAATKEVKESEEEEEEDNINVIIGGGGGGRITGKEPTNKKIKLEEEETGINNQEKRKNEAATNTTTTTTTSKEWTLDEDMRASIPPPGTKDEAGIRILEGLAASGLRSIRYAREVGGVMEVVANDISFQAVNCMRRNIEHNKVEDLVTSSISDASMVMYKNREPENRFHAIDLDPYGSPHTFLDGAVQCVSEGGVLLVTCTDMAVLCGNSPETCYAKYGALSLKSKACHEMALRIVLQCLESHANRYGRYIVPLLSLSADFYVRVVVRVFTSKAKVKETFTKVSWVYQCVGCETVTLQPLGRILVSGKSIKHQVSQGPPVTESCTHCGHRHVVGGPVWSAPIHDRAFLRALKESLAEEDFGTYRRMLGTITMMEEELPDVPLYYVLDRMARVAGINLCKMVQFRSALLNAGYRVSLSHAACASLKTDAPANVVWDVVRAWERQHPANKSAMPPDRPAKVILEKEIRTEVSFELHEDANPESRRKDMLRFQMKPEKFWGPKSRAKTSVLHGTLEEKRIRKQGKKRQHSPAQQQQQNTQSKHPREEPEPPHTLTPSEEEQQA